MRSLILLAALFLFNPVAANAANLDEVEGAAFTNVPELTSGFRMLYIQKFDEGRAQFVAWAEQHRDDPFFQRVRSTPWNTPRRRDGPFPHQYIAEAALRAAKFHPIV